MCVRKKDGRLRLCVDYRALNEATVPDNYTIPRIDYIKQHVRGTIFTTIDLKDGFLQVPVAPEDIPKTAVKTPWGLFEYVRMPFGLRNAPPTFKDSWISSYMVYQIFLCTLTICWYILTPMVNM